MIIRVDLKLPLEARTTNHLRRVGAGLLEVLQDPAVIGVCLIAASAVVFAGVLDHRANVRLERLEQSVRAAVRDSIRFEQDLRASDELRRKRVDIERRIADVRTIDHNRFAFVHVLDHAASALVADVWLEEVLTISHDPETGHVQVQLIGFAPNSQTVQRYIDLLERSPFIAGASLASSTTQTINHQEAVRFMIIVSSEVPDVSYLHTETMRPDGSVVSSLDMDMIPYAAPNSPSSPSDGAVGSVQTSTGSRNSTLPISMPTSLPNQVGASRLKSNVPDTGSLQLRDRP